MFLISAFHTDFDYTLCLKVTQLIAVSHFFLSITGIIYLSSSREHLRSRPGPTTEMLSTFLLQ